MSALAYVDFGASWLTLFLAVVLVNLDRRSRVNQLFALIWAAYVVPTAASGFLLLASDESRWLFSRVSMMGYTWIFNVANPLVLGVFLRIPRRWLVPVALVVVPVGLGETVLLWTGPAVAGFVSTPWGTATVMKASSLLATVDLAANFFAFLVMLASLVVRSVRSASPRLKSLARRFLVALLVLAALQTVAMVVMDNRVIVDVTPAVVLLLAFFHSFVLLRYRPWGLASKNLETFLFQTDRDGVFLLDEDLRILDANPATARTTGSDPSALRGRDWPSLFENGAAIRAQVTSLAKDRFEHLESTRDGVALTLSLRWTLDALGHRMGAVATVRKRDALAESLDAHLLTAREQEVALHLIQGATNKEIGELLFISAGTVKNHVVNIFKKTGATNRVELSRLLTEPEPSDP